MAIAKARFEIIPRKKKILYLRMNENRNRPKKMKDWIEMKGIYTRWMSMFIPHTNIKAQASNPHFFSLSLSRKFTKSFWLIYTSHLCFQYTFASLIQIWAEKHNQSVYLMIPPFCWSHCCSSKDLFCSICST